jgi:hypothetical protein
MNKITYIGCRTAPKELTALLNHEVVATAANDSDAYTTRDVPAATQDSADILPILRPH